jgi:rod shape-determining protein MreB and related proteins
MRIGIDLGTANTMVWVERQGIVISEPSVVARHKDSGAVLAVGVKPSGCWGKHPETLKSSGPYGTGLLLILMRRKRCCLTISVKSGAMALLARLIRPVVAIGIPSGVTEVERRAVKEAAISAGARDAYLLEEPMAAAIGAGLKVLEPEGRMMVDIGGGTAEIAVISLGGMVINRSIRIAGDEFDDAIIRFARIKYGLLVGEATAEQVKLAVGSAYVFEKKTGRGAGSASGVLQAVVRGRDLGSGLPRSVKFTSIEVREALAPVVQQIVQTVKDVLEETPPELTSDILQGGIVLAGGSSLLRGLDQLIGLETRMPVWRMDDPIAGVVNGCGKVLLDKPLLERVKVVGGLME